MSRGIITLALPFTTAMLISTGAIAQSAGQQTPAQQQQTPRTQQRPMQHDDMQQHAMRGCVAQDPSARGQVGASQMTGAEQTALLTKAAKAAGKSGKTYRLVAAADASFQLAEFVGKQVEVRGTMTPQPIAADEVNESPRAAKGDATTVDSPATDFDDDHKALTVTSITKVADSCAADSSN
jgi:hypothetical protein